MEQRIIAVVAVMCLGMGEPSGGKVSPMPDEVRGLAEQLDAAAGAPGSGHTENAVHLVEQVARDPKGEWGWRDRRPTALKCFWVCGIRDLAKLGMEANDRLGQPAKAAACRAVWEEARTEAFKCYNDKSPPGKGSSGARGGASAWDVNRPEIMSRATPAHNPPRIALNWQGGAPPNWLPGRGAPPQVAVPGVLIFGGLLIPEAAPWLVAPPAAMEILRRAAE